MDSPDCEPTGAGRFRDEGEIARGGMGVIHRLRDTALGRDLAQKILPAESAHRADFARRLQDEARLTSQLDHPGVVPVHDIGLQSDGRFFFTMKLVGGRTLEQVIPLLHGSDDTWTLVRGLNIVLRVCETLAFAHSRRVIHRDLKPENVMIGDFGEVYVMDWGVAKALNDPRPDARDSTDEHESLHSDHEGTVAGTVLGTLGYMPPEQASGDIAFVDERSDIYAIGAILYHLIADERPYAFEESEGGKAAVLRATLLQAPHPLNKVAPKAAHELCAITAKAMARDPEDRYQSAEDLRRDLEAFMEGRVVAAHRGGPLTDLRKWIRRNRALATSIVVTIMLAIGGALAFGVFALDSRAELRFERDKERAARRRAEGLRLAALAESEVERNPALALALGAEGAALAPGDYANSTLYRALESLRERATLMGHHGYVYAVHFSPDGSSLLSIGERPALLLWDCSGEHPPVRFEAPPGRISTARFSPDGRRVVTAGFDGIARVFAAATGEVLQLLPCSGKKIHDVRWSPDGTRIVTASDDGVLRVWNAADGSVLSTAAAHTDAARSVAWHPDGRLLASRGFKSGVRITDAAKGTIVRRLVPRPGREGEIVGEWRSVVGWLADGSQVVSWATHAPCEIWQADTGESIASFGSGETQASEPGWSSQGDYLVAPLRIPSAPHAMHSLMIWDVHQRREVRRIVQQASCGVARFSRDGRQIITASRRRAVHEAVVYDARSGRRVALLRGHTYFVHDVATRADGLIATASADHTVRLWRSYAPGYVPRFPERHLLALSSDGTRAVVGHTASSPEAAPMELRDVVTRQVLRSYPELGRRHTRGILAPDAQTFIGWCPAEARVEAIDLATGHALWSSAPVSPSPVSTFEPRLTVSPDSTRITVSDGSQVRILDVATGQERCAFRFPQGGLGKLAWSADGHTLFGALGRWKRAIAWSAHSGEVVANYDGAHEGWVTYAVSSRDGTLVATAGSGCTVVLWDRATSHTVDRFVGLPRGDLALAFTPDGRYLMVLADSMPTTIFDLQTRKRSATIPFGGLDIPVFPDGGASAMWTNMFSAWRVPLSVADATGRMRPRLLLPLERLLFRVDQGKARAPLDRALLARIQDPHLVAEFACEALSSGHDTDVEACVRRLDELRTQGAAAGPGMALHAARQAHAGDLASASETLLAAVAADLDPELIRHADVFAALRKDARWPALLLRLRAADAWLR